MGYNGARSSYHTALSCIYVVVLLSGVLILSVMWKMVKSNMKSVTRVAVLNLMSVHLLFLITVPFRLYYYFTGLWYLGVELCQVVSGMIHVHMYMVFFFYVVILVVRLISYHKGSDTITFYRKLHAVAFSGVVWSMALVVVPCILYFAYGHANATHPVNNGTKCFQFGSRLHDDTWVQVVNYVLSCVVVLVTCVLTSLQVHVLVVVIRKHGAEYCAQQEFWAQLKSLCFALILVVCYVPYNLFRIYYVTHTDLENVNEIFLCLTTISCFDVITFMGRASCYNCLTLESASYKFG